MLLKGKFYIDIKATSDTAATIKISGEISSWRNSSDDFQRKVDDLIAKGIKDVTLYINSGGGSVFEAFEIYNIIKQFTGTIKAEIGALCASAATIIACAASEVNMASNGNYMIHRPMIASVGNEDTIESDLQALKNVKQSMLDMYVAKTGIQAKEIEKLWKGDYWMTALQAKEKGFVDSIKGEAKLSEEEIEATLSAFKNIPEAIRASITKQVNQNPKQDDMKFIAAKLGLKADASEAEITSAIEALATKAAEYDTLKASIVAKEKADKEANIKSVIDTAIKANKFTEEYRSTFTAKLEANYDAAKKEIEAIKPVASLLNHVQQEGNPVAGIPSERKDWKYADWAEKDNKGLLALKESYPETFKALAQAHYGN